ncbi:MAG: hypothetical protein LOY03_01505 [Cyclobacteriaceae bacterium]|jgi:hypothetical protein|nr:hypothetical protein [Cyclobacteriaceae bacterium]
MNMRYLAITILFSCAVLISIWSCEGLGADNDAQYDSLFMGFYLGMDRQAFFDRCWDLNRQQVFTNGPTERSVEWKMTSEFDHPVICRFYPTFEHNRIYELPVLFSYEAWAPWNRQYQSDSLLVHTLDLFKRWYGDDFKELDHETQGKVYYRIDGKRRINLFIRDEQYVQAVFTDLKVEKELKENEDNEGS